MKTSKIFSTLDLVTLFLIGGTLCVFNNVTPSFLYFEYITGILLIAGSFYFKVNEKHRGIFWALVSAIALVTLSTPALKMAIGEVTWEQFFYSPNGSFPFTFWGKGTILIALFLPFAGMIIAHHLSKSGE